MRSKLVNPRVENLMDENQVYVDSGKKLLLEYWERHDGLRLTPEQKHTFMNATPAESILRSRRDLAPKYPSSKEVEKGREERYKEELEDHSNWKPAAVDMRNS